MKSISMILILLLSVSLMAQQESNSPVIESRSNLSFSETVEIIKASAEKAGWKVLVTHNLQESLKKNGQDVLPVSVIEICKPAYSGSILKNDEPRSLSVLMPCRVSVYEKSDKNVYISRLNITGLDNYFGESSAAIMKSAADEIETLLSNIISE